MSNEMHSQFFTYLMLLDMHTNCYQTKFIQFKTKLKPVIE